MSSEAANEEPVVTRTMQLGSGRAVRRSWSWTMAVSLAATLAVATGDAGNAAVLCEAGDARWVGEGDWNFEDPSNWESGVVPPNGASVCVLRDAHDPPSRLRMGAHHSYLRMTTDTDVTVGVAALELTGPEPSTFRSLEVALSATLAVPSQAGLISIVQDFWHAGQVRVDGLLAEEAPVVVGERYATRAPVDTGGTPSASLVITGPVPPDGASLIAFDEEEVWAPIDLDSSDSVARLELVSGALRVVPAAADATLAVTVAATSTSPFVYGHEVDVYVTVSNTGAQPASGTTVTIGAISDHEQYWASHERCWPGDGQPGTCRLPDIPPGGRHRMHLLMGFGTERSSGVIPIGAAALNSPDVAETTLSFDLRRPDPLTRVAGEDRVRTAVAVSHDRFADVGGLAVFRDRALAAVVTRSDAYPDALVAAPLAASRRGPILLTDSHELSAPTAAELVRILPAGSDVYLVGGMDSLSPEVEAALVRLGFDTVRLAGDDRYETARIVAEALPNATEAWLADGENFPDALVAGGAAARRVSLPELCCDVVLLTRGSELPAATAAILDRYPTRFAVGGNAAAADRGARAFVGADRYATALLVADSVGYQPSIVTGENWPDGLAVGARGGAMLLVPTAGPLPDRVADFLGGVGAVTVYGGDASVSAQMASQIEQNVRSE